MLAVEEGWQQPARHLLSISLPRFAFDIPLLLLSVLVPALGSPGHGEQLPWRSPGGGGSAGRACGGPAGGRQAVPVVAIASPLHPYHHTQQCSQPSLLPQRWKMNWVGGSR